MDKGNNLMLKREVSIRNKASKSAYFTKNVKFIEPKPQRLGSSISANNEIKNQSNLLSKVMPTILGVSENSNNWFNMIDGYLNGITIIIPLSDKKLNTSLLFDSPNDLKEFEKGISEIEESYTKELKAANGDENGDIFRRKHTKLINLEEVVLGKAKPVNPRDYLAWRYAIVHREVANRERDINKSNKIRFFIYDENERKRAERALYIAKREASKLYFDISSNNNKVDAILNVIIAEKNLRIDTSKFDNLDRQKTLFEQVDKYPTDFVRLVNDENLVIKSDIEKYITSGILRRPTNSTMIIDNENNDIIGQNIDDVIVFFKNEKNKLTLAKIKERFNSLPK